MQVNVRRRPGSVVELEIEVPKDRVDRAVEQAFAQLAARVKVDGFRPGKAPREVLERQIGWPTLREQALEILVPEAVSQAVADNKLLAIDTPRVDVATFERDQAAKLTAQVTVKPEVKLGALKRVKAPLLSPAVGEDKVDRAIEDLRTSFAELVPAGERPVRSGDHLVMDIEMRRADGGPVETPAVDQQIDVDPDRLLPGMAEGLIGAVAGETREIDVTLPADYRNQDLAGQPVTFSANVKEVKQRNLPPVDDELAKMTGAGETMAELRTVLQERIQAAAERDAVLAQQKAALDALIAGSEFEVPEVMVEDEIHRELRNVALRFQQQGVDFDKLVEFGGLDLDKLHEESRPGAAERVRQELVLDALATTENLDPSDEHVTVEARRTLSGTPDETRLLGSERVREYVRERLRFQWALLWLAAHARGESWTPPPPDAGIDAPHLHAAEEIVERHEPVPNEQGMVEI